MVTSGYILKGKLTEYAKVLNLRCEKREQPTILMGLLSETRRIELSLTGMGKTFHGYCQILNSSHHDFSVGDSNNLLTDLSVTLTSPNLLSTPSPGFLPFWSIVWSYPVCLKSFSISWVTAKEAQTVFWLWALKFVASSARNFIPFFTQLNSFPIFLFLCNSYFLSRFKHGLFFLLQNFPHSLKYIGHKMY